MKTITTQKVNCKDCHRCVRSCPVKAIGIEKGHARLVEDKCILCGKCVVECPQHAKQVENQLDIIKNAIRSGRKVIMSLAPSFVGVFTDVTPAQFIAQICDLGFAAVEETALGAEIVSNHYLSSLKSSQETVISACCPVVVNLIEKYYPDLTERIAPVVSPMIAHGRLIRHKYGANSFIVFAGPCIAKIDEGHASDSDIDAVITFEQLKTWIPNSHECLSENKFDMEAWGKSRYFPISGGILKSFVHYEDTDAEIVKVDGIEKCMEIFESIAKKEISPRFVEALACTGGCISGPACGNLKSTPAKRNKVLEFAQSSKADRHEIPVECNFNRIHRPLPIHMPQPTEEQIRDILAQTGKFLVTDEKNCGACGYNSCREKAIAVYQGLAEIDMCVPYMRSKAESFANLIVDNSLNAIIVVDEKMIIQEFNPAAETMFNRKEELIKGLSLTEIMDCSDFFEVARTGEKIAGKRVEYPLLGLVTEQMIIPVREHGLVFAIFMDITADERRTREVRQMKLETVEKATEIINKQMHVAQEIAGLLGETTAETKSALLELIWLIRDKEAK